MTEICCIQDDGLYKRQKNMEEDGAVASITCNSLRSGTFRIQALIAMIAKVFSPDCTVLECTVHFLSGKQNVFRVGHPAEALLYSGRVRAN